MGLFQRKDENYEIDGQLVEEIKAKAAERAVQDTASEAKEVTKEIKEEKTNETYVEDSQPIAEVKNKEESKVEKKCKKKINPKNITDEELDKVADCGIEVLQSILSCYNLGDITIDEYEGDGRELILNVTGNDLSILIGYHGRTLDALQNVVSIVVNKKLGLRYPIFVDVEGYKNRRSKK
ncbi:MAG: KH domain-containing protein [Eggerthellaceae bacterium]|nr:KH domain-containing protein [Eggerthellaceae bacterium]